MDAKYTGEVIAALRKEQGLTQKELAAKVHVTDKAVSKWERGLNFPELPVLETLAVALETTVTHLLGIEEAGKEEVVDTFTELSEKQAEETARNMRYIGWLMVAAAMVLAAAYSFIEDRLRTGSYFSEIKATARIVKYLLFAIGIGGCVILKKYEAIKAWNIADWLLTYLIVGGVLGYGGMYLKNEVTSGELLSDIWFLIAYVMVVSSTQVLFYRVMKSYAVKTLPLAVSIVAGFLCGLDYVVAVPEGTVVTGRVMGYYIFPAVVCLGLWLLCLWKDKERQKVKIPGRQTALFCGLVVLVLFLFGQDFLARTYVKLFHNQLEEYAEGLLLEASEEVVSDKYGFWKVTCYKDSNLVEFQTGGSGLVTNSRYWGFYYSPEDKHKAFQGYDCELEQDKYRAEAAGWEEPETDNGGTSVRMFRKWYWFEAHF